MQTALELDIIDKNEFKHMDPTLKNPGKFYELFKGHKPHVVGSPPPERPIISTCGSITENIGVYVQNVLKRYSNIHDSYIQDTPDLLRVFCDLNDENIIEDDDILVTVDVTGLYTNIQKNEGMEAVREVLEKHSDNDMKNIFVLELLELILSQNIFEFDEKLYRQEIGTSMGGKPAPDYANIFMAKLD